MSVSCSFQRNLSARRWKLPQSLKYVSNFNYKPPKPEYQQTARTLSKSAKTCSDEEGSSTAPGTQCVCVCVSTRTPVAYVYTGASISVATESFSTFPVFQKGACEALIRMKMMMFWIIYDVYMKPIKDISSFKWPYFRFHIMYT